MIQILIAITGSLAIWLVNDPRPQVSRWAPIIGLSGQPFWFWETVQAQQWGMFFLTMIFTIAWAKGFYHRWVQK